MSMDNNSNIICPLIPGTAVGSVITVKAISTCTEFSHAHTIPALPSAIQVQGRNVHSSPTEHNEMLFNPEDDDG